MTPPPVPATPREARVLVVGARTGSLGYHVAREVRGYRAGVTDEPLRCDITNGVQIGELLDLVEPTHVVCTVGINESAPVYDRNFMGVAQRAMEVNYDGPMRLLAYFERRLGDMPGTYVAISSNSARIARSNSAAYCASKAALSMGLRCAARDLSRAGKPLRVWGYEPGALLGTPMTKEVSRGLGKDVPMSRMLTNPAGMPVAAVARIVARDLLDSSEVLHGCVVRLDNGEQ